MEKKKKVLITDLDNTLYSWVDYIVPAMKAMISKVVEITGVDEETLIAELKKVYEKKRTLEYAFVLQEIDIFKDLIRERGFEWFDKNVIVPARDAFDEVRRRELKLYDGVREGFEALRKAGVKIYGITDAPRFPAIYRLKFLNIDGFFDAVYALENYDFPEFVADEIIELNRKGVYDAKCDVVELPLEYEKPNTKGVEQIISDRKIDEDDALILGDNIKKDIRIARELGIFGVWAKYGTEINPEHLKELQKLSPVSITRRNVAESREIEDIVPDAVADKFSDVLQFFI